MAAIEIFSTQLFNDPNLVAYYRLENVNDSKGSRNLTNHGSTAFNPAKFNNGADGGNITQGTKWLDNTSDNYGIAGGAISFGGWVKMGLDVPNTQVYEFFQHASATNNVTEDIQYDNSGGTPTILARRIRNGVAIDSVSFVITLGTSTFHHLFLTYDGVTLTLYIDGVAKGTTPASGNGSSGANTGFSILATIGGADTNHTTGIGDDVPIFSRALTPNEVLGLFQGFPQGLLLSDI